MSSLKVYKNDGKGRTSRGENKEPKRTMDWRYIPRKPN